ncbi:MAG: hypothetical protein NTV81_02865 [Candidatus Komeilibacteria bacterium]|nr:hypothetical protein [Candidatus Komeilibacteria bacterium]
MINEERWQELKERLQQKFSNFKLEDKSTTEPPVTQEYAYFSLPSSPRVRLGEAGQEIRLIWSKRPKVLDKKTHYSNRAGGDVQVDYQYAADEYVYSLEAEQELGGNWVKADFNEIINYFS